MNVRRQLLIVGLALSGCSDPTAPVFRVGIAVDRRVLPPSDSVNVLVTYTNLSDQDVAIEVSQCMPRFEVTDASGNVVPGPSIVCTLMATMHTMRPGERYEFQRYWRAEAPTGPGGAMRPLPAGTYFFRLPGRNRSVTVEAPIAVQIQ